MSTSQVATTASTVIDLTLPLRKKGNLNDILGLSKSTNRSKIRAEKEEFLFESIIFCNPHGLTADSVKKKKTLIQAGRGMLSLTKKRPVVKFRTVKFDVNESEDPDYDSISGCTSAIPSIDDGSLESNKSCHTIYSYLETSPSTSTRVKRKRTLRKKRKTSSGGTTTASSTRKKVKYDSSEFDIFDDSNTFANYDDDSSPDEIDPVPEPGVSYSEFDADCYIIDRCPDNSSLTDHQRVAEEKSETTNLELPTSFYTIDRQPDDTYLSKSTTALEPEVSNSKLDAYDYVLDRCPDKSSLTELEEVATAESETTNADLSSSFYMVDRQPDTTHVTSVLESGATDSKLDVCCWSIDRHSENHHSQSSAAEAVDCKTTYSNPAFHCYGMDGDSSDSKLPNRAVETILDIGAEGVSSRSQEIMEEEFESDMVEETNSKKRRKRRRKRRKGRLIGSDNIFQKADATKKKFFDFLNAFKSDP